MNANGTKLLTFAKASGPCWSKIFLRDCLALGSLCSICISGTIGSTGDGGSPVAPSDFGVPFTITKWRRTY
jgi:hypothetical protein